MTHHPSFTPHVTFIVVFCHPGAYLNDIGPHHCLETTLQQPQAGVLSTCWRWCHQNVPWTKHKRTCACIFRDIPLCSKEYRPRLLRWWPPTGLYQLLWRQDGGFRPAHWQSRVSSSALPDPHTVVQSKSRSVNHNSSVEDLQQKEKPPAVFRLVVSLQQLRADCPDAHRLDDEEDGSEQPGHSAETHLQILNRNRNINIYCRSTTRSLCL